RRGLGDAARTEYRLTRLGKPSARPPLSPALVRCGAVDRREWDVVEAEVHAELPAMMDEMVDVCAQHGAARQGHEDTVAMLERPDHPKSASLAAASAWRAARTFLSNSAISAGVVSKLYPG